GSLVRRHHEEETVHPVSDDAAILDGAERWRVHHDVVVATARFIEELAEPRRLEHLVSARRRLPGRDDGQIEWQTRPGDVLQSEAGIKDGCDQAGAIGGAEREEAGHR